jgi:hypothetical protein
MNIFKLNGSKVELRKNTGSLIRTIVRSKAVNAKFSGSELLVTTDKGKIEVRKESGSLIRTI